MVSVHDIEDMVSLVDFHPNLDAVGTGNGAFADGSVGIGDLNLDRIRDVFSWPSAEQQLLPSDATDTLTTMTQRSPSQYGMTFDQWNYLETMSEILPYWQEQGFQNEALGYRIVNGYLALGEEQPQPPSTSSATGTDETLDWDFSYLILRRAGAVGILTTGELYDVLIALFSNVSWMAMSPQNKLRKLPNKLIKVLGWDKGSPFALPLARAIAEYLGEEILTGDELEFMRGM